jgi:glycosyltransferase involved in cell wall biosynthesis
MIDYIPDIFNLLNASDFVILPSIANEDFPFIVIEAMSLGKPAIGTDIAGMPEQIENNKTGIIVKPKNSDELLQAIMLLAINPLLLQQYSILAKIRFDTLFEESISVRKYYDLYKSI